MCVKRVSNLSRRLSKDAREFCISRRYFESEKKNLLNTREFLAKLYGIISKFSVQFTIRNICMLCGYEMPTFENPPG